MHNKNDKMRYGLLFLFLLLLGSLNAIAQGLPKLTHGLSAISGNKMAPALRFKNLDGETVDIAALRGRVVVVNFWATWCPPCRREMGSLQHLYQATADQGVEVLAVNIGEDEDTVFSFMGTVEPTPEFQMLLDLDGVSMDTWSVRGLPTTYLVAPDGSLAYRAIGGREFDHPDILDQVRRLNIGGGE